MVTEQQVPKLLVEVASIRRALADLSVRLDGVPSEASGIRRDAIALDGRASVLQGHYIDLNPRCSDDGAPDSQLLGAGFSEVYGAASRLRHDAEVILARCAKILGYPMTGAQAELLRHGEVSA